MLRAEPRPVSICCALHDGSCNADDARKRCRRLWYFEACPLQLGSLAICRVGGNSFGIVVVGGLCIGNGLA